MSLAHLCLASQRPARPLSGRIDLPGDEATGHLALLLAALAVGESRVSGLLDRNGVPQMASALRDLGAEIVQDAPDTWRVAGRGVGGLREPGDVLDIGGSAIAAQLLCGVLASHDLFATVTGSASLRRRPMPWMAAMLRDCGARVLCPSAGWLPLAIQGARDALPIERRLSPPSASAKPALLLAGLNAPGWTRIAEAAPTCDQAAQVLRHFGANVMVEPFEDGCITSVLGQPELRAADLAVPGAPSWAAYPLVAALIVPGSVVTVRGVAMGSPRAGLFAVLQEMGAQLEITGERLEAGGLVADVTARHTGLHGTDVPAARATSMADDLPILAVAAACADGPTRIRGHAGLRAEGGPLSAAAAMLRLNDIHVQEEGGDLTVHGRAAPAGGIRIGPDTAPRIALCGLILGLAAAAPIQVDKAALIDEDVLGLLALLRQVGAPFA